MRQLVAAALLSAISIPTFAEERVLVLDAWWTLDYAKSACLQARAYQKQNSEIITKLGCATVTACTEMLPRMNACANDPSADVALFFRELNAQLASRAECNGIQVASYGGPSSANSLATQTAMTKPHKTLIVDFVPGMTLQSWSLTEKGTLLQGEGDPKKIAVSVCNILNVRGAKIVE
jgi:hypothetical protein